MKYLFLLLIVSASVSYAVAQDTLFLGSDNKPVSKKKNASHFKVITNTDTGYVVEFLDKDQFLIGKTTYKDPDLKFAHGYSVGYLGKTLGSEGRYVDGKEDGIWKYYHWDGKVSGIVTYKSGKRVNEEYFRTNGERETDLKKAEQLPSFQGGMRGLGEYLGRTLRYPPQARERNISGQVKVGFTVSTSGELLNIRVISGPDDELNREALRVVRLMPRWVPGVQFNRPVKVAYVLPVNFQLSQ